MFLAKLCLELGVKLLKSAMKIRKLHVSLIRDEKLRHSMPIDVHFHLEYAFSIAIFTEAWPFTNFFVASFIVRSCRNGTIQWFELLASSLHHEKRNGTLEIWVKCLNISLLHHATLQGIFASVLKFCWVPCDAVFIFMPTTLARFVY